MWRELNKCVLGCATISVGQFSIMEVVNELFCCKAGREFNSYSESNGKHLEDCHQLITKVEIENMSKV